MRVLYNDNGYRYSILTRVFMTLCVIYEKGYPIKIIDTILTIFNLDDKLNTIR